MTKLSIVIPAYNEEKYLPGLLKSIKAQNYPCEVIVGNAQSTDATAIIAKAWGAKVVPAKKGTPAMARNSGALAATGDLILFLDADVTLPANFLKKTVKEMDKKKMDVAGCYLRPDSAKIFDEFIITGVVNGWYSFFQHFWPNLIGCCIFARKKAHKKIGGFDETITFAEDSAYVYEAFKQGLKFGFLTSGKVYLSMRRFDKEGRLDLCLRYMDYTLRRVAGEIRTEVKYDYGHY